MYDAEIATRICVELSAGRSLRAVCTDEGMPDKATVFRWLAAHEEFRDQYARARDAQADAMLEDILEIADQYETAAETLNPDLVQRAKLRIDTRKWAMSKMAPKKYGDKITNEHTGADGSPIVFKTVYETK